VKVAILVRHLKPNRSVAMAVIVPPSWHINNFENYVNGEVERIKYEFVSKFPEFADSAYYVDFLEIS